ncbi:hypothetical protein [Cupriavidus sp. SK-3]|uniref:hypothetical protein n=1 Tax=Cupriavidus sp. SK-3 TaxID=1470558 RepID=UPI001363EC0F|nr:hypothetical protein [Cupriavidus sp. SK-3]
MPPFARPNAGASISWDDEEWLSIFWDPPAAHRSSKSHGAFRFGLHACRYMLRLDAGNNIWAIAIGAGLMVYLDRNKRQEFLKRWNDALAQPR